MKRSLLKRIFCNIFGFSYIEKRRNKADYYVRENDPYSRIAVINTQESNIKDITDNETYLENIYATLVEDYKFPVDQSAVYYFFDRDPDSNTDIERIQSYIVELKNPYEKEEAWLESGGFKLFSMLTLAFLQLGIIEI